MWRFIRRSVAIVLFLLIFIAAVWRFFHGEELIKQIALRQARPYTGNSLKIDKLDIELEQLKLSDIQYSVTPEILLKANSLTVQTSLAHIIFKGIQSRGSIQKISIDSLQFVYKLSPDEQNDDKKIERDPINQKELIQKVISILADLKFLNTIHLSNSSFLLESLTKDVPNTITIVNDLSGEITYVDSLFLSIQIDGRVAGDSLNYMDLYGAVDFTNSSFYLENSLDAKRLATLNETGLLPEMEIENGELETVITFNGRNSLRYDGNIDLKNLCLNYQDEEKLCNAGFRGQFSEKELSVAGKAILFGLEFPFKFNMAEPHKGRFSLSGKNTLDLANFSSSEMPVDSMSGLVDFTIDVSGNLLAGDSLMSSLDSRLDLVADEMRVGSLRFEDLNLSSRFDKETLLIREATTNINGGKLVIKGNYNLRETKRSRLDINFVRNFNQDDRLPEWIIIDNPSLIVQGEVSNNGNDWSVHAESFLLDQEEYVMAEGKVDYENKMVTATVTGTEEQSGKIRVQFNTQADKCLKLSAINPYMILDPIVKRDFLPYELYGFDIVIDGELFVDTSLPMFFHTAKVELQAQHRLDRKNLSFKSDINSDSTGVMDISGELELQLREDNSIGGNFDVHLTDSTLVFNRCQFVNEKDFIFLYLNGKLGLKDEQDSLVLVADEFPLFRLSHFVKPGLMPNLDGVLSTTMYLHNDTLEGKGKMDLVLEKKTKQSNVWKRFTAAFETEYNLQQKNLDIEKLVLLENHPSNNPEFIGDRIVDLAGEFTFSDSIRIDSLKLALKRLSIEDVLEAIAPDMEAQWGGFVNSRLNVDGTLPYPDINVDAHMSSGVLYGNDGYWANLRIVTDNDLYLIDQIDFGRGISGLIRGMGYFNRNQENYQIELEGIKSEISELLQAATGKEIPLSGESEIAVLATGVKASQWKPVIDNKWRNSVNASITISDGAIGPLGFNRITSHARFNGYDDGKPQLEIDSVYVDWGDSYARIHGTIPFFKRDTANHRDVEMNITGIAEGRISRWLARISDIFSNPKGKGKIDLEVGGFYDSPKIRFASLNLDNFGVEMDEVLGGFNSIDAEILLDSSGTFRIENFKGKIDDRSFEIANRFPVLYDTLEADEQEKSLVVGGYDFGIVQMRTEEEGVWVVIPGLMRKTWGGYFRITGLDGSQYFELLGPVDDPTGRGRVDIRNATITFPLLDTGGGNAKGNSGEPNPVADFFMRMNWDALVVPVWDNRYVNELAGFGNLPIFDELNNDVASNIINLDVKLYIDLLLDDESSRIKVKNSVTDSLSLSGEIVATQGTIEYLDMKFEVEKIGVQFTPGEIDPIIYGSAVTSVIDSFGIHRDINLVIKNKSTDGYGLKSGTSGGAKFDEIKLVLEDDQGHSQEQILAMLGYTPDQIGDKLSSLGGIIVENAVPIRRWTRFIERSVERFLGIDRFELESRAAQNLLIQGFYADSDSGNVHGKGINYLTALDQSRITIGKYINRDLYVSYSGVLQQGEDVYNETQLGMQHYWDIVYRLRDFTENLNLNYRYEYNTLTELDDNSIRISYSFYIDQ